MIWLLEDDASIRKFVIYALESVGFEAKGFGLPSEFWAELESAMPRLLLLDIMLPEEEGTEILKELRADPKTANLPVIMLTAKGSEYDKVIGLDLGADDYVTKPFGTMELVSRIKAVLRRSGDFEKTDEIIYKNLYICPSKHIVKVDGAEITLTLKEFELLNMLFQNKGKVLNRDRILGEIWGYSFDGESRTVDVHIKTLRTKLKTAAELIETVRGIGYKLGE